jgi:hypothetical protein
MKSQTEQELMTLAEKSTLKLLVDRAQAELEAGNRRAARHVLLIAAKLLQDEA